MAKSDLYELSTTYQKPIVFTEFGYRSIDKSAGKQWELPHHRGFAGALNFQAQTNAYTAIF